MEQTLLQKVHHRETPFTDSFSPSAVKAGGDENGHYHRLGKGGNDRLSPPVLVTIRQ
jgi:hypothetical protein